jgi:hypothetical protein
VWLGLVKAKPEIAWLGLWKKINCIAAKLSDAYFFDKDPVKHSY